MKEIKNGEYLAPEIKVVEINCAQLVATSNEIEDTSEGDENPWN